MARTHEQLDIATAPDSGVHVSVVIPTFKAERHVADVVRGLPEWVGSVVCVDDCSPDGSAAAIEALDDPRVHVLRHDENQGVGGATLTGYRHAARLGADVIVKMDADDQMDPAYLPALIAPILRGEADYTKGNRFLHLRQLQAMPLKRRVGNLGLSFLTKVATGYWRMFDPTNGYTAIHASLVDELDDAAIDRRYFFESSMLVELSLHRAVVRDVFIPARYGDEKSNLSELRSLFGFPPRQARGLMRRLWMQHFLRDFGLLPLFLFGGLGLVSFGTVFGAYQWYLAYVTGDPRSAGTVMVAMLPLIVGFQMLLQAIALDVQHEPKAPVHPELRSTAHLRDYVLPRAVPAESGARPTAGIARDEDVAAGSPGAR
jgi:dolichol-phosphate mannosyltransferase